MSETDFFWRIAQPFLDGERATRGTMMGFPCLRAEGQFFASALVFAGLVVSHLGDRKGRLEAARRRA